MKYQTRLNNNYSQVEIPVYDELGREIGTAKVNENKTELTISHNPDLIEKMMKENLLRDKAVFCHLVNYKEFINE